MTETETQQIAKLKAMGVKVVWRCDGWGASCPWIGQEAVRDELDEALEVGREMVAQKPPERAQGARSRKRAFWLMPPKARLKARIRAHNKKVAARQARRAE